MTETVKDILSRFLFRFTAFLRYWWRAKTIYRVHSPLVADFIRTVLEDRRLFYAFGAIEWLRRQLLDGDTTHAHLDFGTGRSGPISLRRLVRRSASSPARGAFLFRLSLWRQPRQILELGTSVGIGALYLGAADRRVRLIGLEGCPHCCALAAAHVQRIGLPQATVRCGPLAETLPEALRDLGQIDLAHFDGDHRGAATWEAFERVLPYAPPGALLVFDDIYWSADMHAAWQRIAAHPSVRLSIDCFHSGLAFLEPGIRKKQHFVLAPRWWKPFQLY